MKEGSFTSHIADLDFTSPNQSPLARENEIAKIKTPDEMPNAIDLSRVPDNILRSGVIESLIQQNDDLMSRLNVNLRRIANLEEKLTDTLNESAQYKAKYENIKDQMLILREQSRLLSERIRNTENKNTKDSLLTSELKEQIQILEIRYAELVNSNQIKTQRLEGKLSTAERLNKAYKKYRQNVRNFYKNINGELKTAREKILSQNDVIQDLKRNLAETTEYITTQAKEHKIQNATLTAAYEAEIKSYKGEIEMLIEQNRVLGERVKDFDRIYNEKVQLENNLVIAERREEDLRIQTAAEISDAQKALARYRSDAKSLSIELSKKQNEIDTLSHSQAELKDQNHKLSEQVDTLQLLWREQQTQIEKTNEQKNSLQKLNQELSITINEYRREIRELKNKIDALEQKNYEQSQLHKMKEQTLNKVATQSDEHTKNTSSSTEAIAIKREDTVTPEIISKIDKVLNNLHVGR